MKKYTNYKDSGVEWIGEIPEHWEVKKMKLVANITRGAILRPVDEPTYFDNNGEWTYLNISDATICDKYLDYGKLRLSELGSQKSARVEPNNLIITASATIGKPFITKIPVCVHDGFIPFKELKIDIDFLYYYFKNPSLFNGLGKSNTQKNIYLDDVKNLFICYPSQSSEQIIIAKFLDRKTAELDTLIANKKSLIELLKEERTAIINHAITKGINPNVKYKDSGIEWIGEIPEHWNISKLKFHTKKIIDGAHFTPTYIDDKNGVPFLRVTDIHNEFINLDEVKRIPLEEHNELIKRCNPQKGDLLLSKNGTIGLMKIIDWDWEFSTFVSLCLIKFENSLLNKFFLYLFLSDIVDKQLFESSQKTSVSNLHLEKIKELRIILPPLSEQMDITNFLDKKTLEVNTIISQTEKEIDLLKEYKTALISEVVLGKVDVREEILSESGFTELKY